MWLRLKAAPLDAITFFEFQSVLRLQQAWGPLGNLLTRFLAVARNLWNPVFPDVSRDSCARPLPPWAALHGSEEEDGAQEEGDKIKGGAGR